MEIRDNAKWEALRDRMVEMGGLEETEMDGRFCMAVREMAADELHMDTVDRMDLSKTGEIDAQADLIWADLEEADELAKCSSCNTYWNDGGATEMEEDGSIRMQCGCCGGEEFRASEWLKEG